MPEKRRPVTIGDLTLLRQEGEGRFLLEMTCSRGTYVRTVGETGEGVLTLSSPTLGSCKLTFTIIPEL